MSWLTNLWNKLMKRKPKPPIIIPPPPSSITFNDDFNTGALNPANWIVSTWSAPQGGVFRANMIDLSQGMLCLKMSQIKNPDGSILSVGSEVQYAKICGYGTYEWTVKASSTAQTPYSTGSAASGSVTGLFNFVTNSATELDLEIEGSRPDILSLTTWHGTGSNQNTFYNYNALLNSAFHVYKYIWSPGKVEYYLDGLLVGTHTTDVPTAPAYPMMNHWGTNNANFGGVATPGIDRYMWVSNFKFTAAP